MKKPAPGVVGSLETAQSLGLLGNVTVDILPGFDAIILRGPQRDVEMVKKIIDEIEKIAEKTQPQIEVYQLKQVDCMEMANLVYQIYNQVYYSRQGDLMIVGLVRPNALLLVGRKENVDRAKELADKLDLAVDPDTQVKVFFLKYATAGNLYQYLQYFYTGAPPAERWAAGGLGGGGLGGGGLGAGGAAATGGGLPPVVRIIPDVAYQRPDRAGQSPRHGGGRAAHRQDGH